METRKIKARFTDPMNRDVLDIRATSRMDSVNEIAVTDNKSRVNLNSL